jgi:hypothetical protein
LPRRLFSLGAEKRVRCGVRIKRKPGVIYPDVELHPTLEYDRERRRIAGLPRTQGEAAAVTTVGVVDVSEREWSLSDALDMIERKACAVLEKAGLHPQVADYRKGLEYRWAKTAFVSKIRPRQPRHVVTGEVVDALRALSILRRMRDERDHWGPYEHPAYRPLNDRPISMRRSQVAERLDSIAEAALELGIIAERLQIRRHEPEVARDRKRQAGTRKPRVPRTTRPMRDAVRRMALETPTAKPGELWLAIPEGHGEGDEIAGIRIYRDGEKLVQADNRTGAERAITYKTFQNLINAARKNSITDPAK